MRALMLDPGVLLLDEPLGALDPLIRFDLQEDLKRIFQQLKKTVVLVTHDLGEAGFFGDRVIMLGEGRIVQDGTLDDLVRRRPAILSAALSMPSESPLTNGNLRHETVPAAGPAPVSATGVTAADSRAGG